MAPLIPDCGWAEENSLRPVSERSLQGLNPRLDGTPLFKIAVGSIASRISGTMNREKTKVCTEQQRASGGWRRMEVGLL